MQNDTGAAVTSQTITVTNDAYGAFSNVFETGFWKVTGELLNDALTIYVPDDANTYQLLSLRTNAIIQSTNFPGAFITTIYTNGVPASTNRNGLNFIYGSNVVVTATNNLASNRLDVAISATAGGLVDASTTNQYTLTNTFNTTVTATSNALYRADNSLWLNSLGVAHGQIDGGTGPFKFVVISDTATYYAELANTIAQRIGVNGYDIPVGSTFLVLTNGAITNRSVVEQIPAVYTNFLGSYYDMGNGAVLVVSNNTALNGGSIYCNEIGLRAVGWGGGGTLSLWAKSNGVAPTYLGTFDTSGAHRHVVTNFSVLPGWYQPVISNLTSGTVHLLGPKQGDTNSAGLCVVGGTINANFDSSQISLYATNITYSFFTNLNPSLVFIHEISGATNYYTNAAALATFVTNAFKPGSVLWSGVWPIADGSDTGINDAVRNYICLSNHIPYFDASSVFRSYADMTNQAGIGDGTHLTVTGAKIFARALWKATWLDAAFSVALANNVYPNSDVPFLSRNQTWTANQAIYGDLLLFGPGTAFVLGDRSLYPANPNARTGFLRDGGVTSIYDYNGGGYMFQIDAGIGAGSRITSVGSLTLNTLLTTPAVTLNGSDLQTLLNAKAPYAATTPGSNAQPANLNLTNWSLLSTGAIANAASNLVIVLSSPNITATLGSTNGSNFYVVSLVATPNVTGLNASGTITGATVTVTSANISGTATGNVFSSGAGSATTPSMAVGAANYGWYKTGNNLGLSIAGTLTAYFSGTELHLNIDDVSWGDDTFIHRTSTGNLVFTRANGSSVGNTSVTLSNGTFNGMAIYKSNNVTAASVAASITNGDFVDVVISNALQTAWMSNNVMNWKVRAP